MAELLYGAPVAERLNEKIINDVKALTEKGINPCLAIVRVGESPDDLAYEKSLISRGAKTGIEVKTIVLPEDVEKDVFQKAILDLNEDSSVHGVLVFNPLPKQLDGEFVKENLSPLKDVDGNTYGSLAGVFTDSNKGFPPCTAEAVMEILDFYGINPEGKKVAVMGRSLVIGKPVAMMLMKKNATVVNCHRKTPDIPAITKEADIVICAMGALRKIDESYVREGQIVIDVGTNWDEEIGKIAGDADFDKVEPIVSKITPVPGGVGTVTTTVLMNHVVRAAEKQIKG